MCNIIRGVVLLPFAAVVVGAVVCIGKIVMLAFTMLAGMVAVIAPFILQLAAILAMLWLIGAVASVMRSSKK